MKKISTRQIIIFYFIYSFAIKFLILPTFLSMGAGRDAWIAAGAGALFELVILFIVLLVIEKKGSVTILMPFMFVFFLVQILITLAHTNNLLGATLYESRGRHMFIVPTLVLGLFFIFSKTRAIFRSGEIFYILILIAIFLAVLPALPKVDASEVLPVLGGGIMPVLRTVYNNIIYFEGALVLLMFKGEVATKKNFKRSFMIWASVGAVVFTLFVFFYCSLFGPLSSLRQLGIVDVTGQNSYLAQNVRIEWLIVCVWLLLLLIRFGVLFYCCFVAVRRVTRTEKLHQAWIAFPLAAVVYIGFMFVPLGGVLNALRIPIAVFIVVVPLLFLILGGRKCFENSGAKKSG